MSRKFGLDVRPRSLSPPNGPTLVRVNQLSSALTNQSVSIMVLKTFKFNKKQSFQPSRNLSFGCDLHYLSVILK